MAIIHFGVDDEGHGYREDEIDGEWVRSYPGRKYPQPHSWPAFDCCEFVGE